MLLKNKLKSTIFVETKEGLKALKANATIKADDVLNISRLLEIQFAEIVEEPKVEETKTEEAKTKVEETKTEEAKTKAEETKTTKNRKQQKSSS